MSINKRAASVIAIGPLVVAGLVALSSPASGATTAIRYASPNGQPSATCPSSEPCDIVTAVNSAPANSNVVVEPGTYGAPTPLASTLSDTNANLYIHGEAGKPRPVIHSAAGGSGAVAIQNGSRISDLKIVFTGSVRGLLVNQGSADHMAVIASGFDACDVTTRLTDSLCVDTAPGSFAMYSLVLSGDRNITYRGVTAEETATDGQALQLDATGHVTITATNSIFHGASEDVSVSPEEAGEVDSIVLSHCDYKTVSIFTGLTLSTESVTADATDIKAVPKFVNAAADNFTERAGSATIDRGASDPAGDTDVVGNPRTLGSAPDIGAFELRQTPTAARLTVTAKTATTATLTVKVNPQGLTTKVRAVAVHGHVTVTSAHSTAGAGRKAKKVQLRIHGLSSHTKYVVYVVVSNAAGHRNTAKKKLTTS